MDAPERGALMLVRFVAAALIGWTVMEFALYWLISQHNHTPMQIFPCLLKSIPALLGIFMLVRARAVAQWISDKFDQ